MKRVIVVTYESGDIIPTQVAEGITDKESKYEIRKFDARKTWQ